VLPADSAAGAEPDSEALIEVITTSIDPQSWGEVGGPGSIEFYAPNLTLVCSHNRRAHAAIGRLLEDLREAASQPVNAEEEKISRALEVPTTLDFPDETPLQDILDYLADYHQVRMVLDKKALDEAGVTSDHPMSAVKLDGVALKSALNLVLSQIDLAYVVRNEVLTITTKANAQAHHPAASATSLKVYKVYPSVMATGALTAGNAEGGAVPGAWEQQLADAIRESVSPGSWTREGGNTIRAVPGALMVRQTAEGHARVKAVLRELGVDRLPAPFGGALGSSR
jgi:hypothetical protein